MKVSGKAMAMGLTLASLAKQHRVPPPEVLQQPLLPDCDGPVILDGFCSVCEPDLDRMQFSKYCFSIRPPFPPLLLKHDPNIVAGTIDELGYDRNGNLRIRCTVDHPLARRMPAFSIGGKINSYTLRNADRPDFFAEVTSADLLEVSLTTTPAQVNAVVLNRYPASATVEFYALLQKKVSKLIELSRLLKGGIPT